LARFGTNLYHHPQPFWYYLPVTLVGLLPWVIFVIAAAGETIRTWWTERREFLHSEDALNAFLLIWLFVPPLFFSLSRSKLPGYIVPALPAGTLLLAEYVRRRARDTDRPSLGLTLMHSLAAVLPVAPALMIQYVVLQRKFPWGQAAIISCVFTLVLAAAISITLRTRLGLRALRFVTLVPVVLTVAAVLRIGAPALDATLSARPLAEEIRRVETQKQPVAALRISRELEFGLHFYRDQSIPRYETGQIPRQEHVVVAPEGSRSNVEKWAAGRRVSYLGRFAPQHVEYYWVGPSVTAALAK
jgi:4-amino-4-deoxy-L-arabinose transferase-like glycosyltransferase